MDLKELILSEDLKGIDISEVNKSYNKMSSNYFEFNIIDEYTSYLTKLDKSSHNRDSDINLYNQVVEDVVNLPLFDRVVLFFYIFSDIYLLVKTHYLNNVELSFTNKFKNEYNYIRYHYINNREILLKIER